VFLRLHKARFGNNMCVYSTLVTVYGHNCKCSEALKVFQSMKKAVCKPNFITYNTIIVDRGKGGVDLKQMLDIFEEM